MNADAKVLLSSSHRLCSVACDVFLVSHDSLIRITPLLVYKLPADRRAGIKRLGLSLEIPIISVEGNQAMSENL